MTDLDLRVIEAMKTYGGSFVKALAECHQRADLDNHARLKTAFPEIWARYSDIVNQNEDQE